MAEIIRLTPKQLAEAVQDEQMTFEDALLHHLTLNLGIAIEGVALYFGLAVAISWANMNCWDEMLDLPTGPATVADIIDQFQLQAFLES